MTLWQILPFTLKKEKKHPVDTSDLILLKKEEEEEETNSLMTILLEGVVSFVVVNKFNIEPWPLLVPRCVCVCFRLDIKDLVFGTVCVSIELHQLS